MDLYMYAKFWVLIFFIFESGGGGNVEMSVGGGGAWGGWFSLNPEYKCYSFCLGQKHISVELINWVMYLVLPLIYIKQF